mmetsp:Transcript_3423/g.2407  ORF Transcript_3423/g.2407 Transcript_3423/m.2407 type:complete len:151 (-) Transcript_3423:184-636(-)
MSAMAERPALIERIFDTKDYNEAGVYVIKFCKNGEWQSVTIDDFIPCFPNGGPIFSRSNGNELWVLLIEKAYAKVHGGYKAISAGLPYEGLMDLTGCPTISYNFKDEIVQQMIYQGKLWELLKYYDSEGYIITGGTPPEKFDEQKGEGEE